MKNQIENHISNSVDNYRLLGLILVIFIAGIITGISLLQFTTNSDNFNQYEEIKIANASIWVEPDQSYSQAAILLVNQGNTTVKLKEIEVQEIECAWSDIYYWSSNISSFSESLNPSINDLVGSTVYVDVDGEERAFMQVTGELVLNSSQSMMLYLRNPGGITQYDVNSKVNVTIFSEKESYSYEITIFSFPMGVEASSLLEVVKIQFTNDGLTPPNNILILTLNNTGVAAVTIEGIKINGVFSPFVTEVSATLLPGDEGVFTVTGLVADWEDGVTYRVDIFDSDGRLVG